MRQFADLLKLPGLALVITAQLLARFPAGMYSLGILMHVEHSQGNYTSAGLVLAAFSIVSEVPPSRVDGMTFGKSTRK